MARKNVHDAAEGVDITRERQAPVADPLRGRMRRRAVVAFSAGHEPWFGRRVPQAVAYAPLLAHPCHPPNSVYEPCPPPHRTCLQGCLLFTQNPAGREPVAFPSWATHREQRIHSRPRHRQRWRVVVLHCFFPPAQPKVRQLAHEAPPVAALGLEQHVLRLELRQGNVQESGPWVHAAPRCRKPRAQQPNPWQAVQRRRRLLTSPCTMEQECRNLRAGQGSGAAAAW